MGVCGRPPLAVQMVGNPRPVFSHGTTDSKKLLLFLQIKAGAEMACFAVFFTIFKLLFLFGIKELGQSVAGKLVAKYLKFNCTHFKSF